MGLTTFLIKYYYRHPRPYAIFLPTSKYSRKEKLAGVRKVAEVHNKKLDEIYRPLLEELKKRYGNRERCFIIGNGPSVNKTDLSKLNNEITFGVNGIFLKFEESLFRPTFYVVEDHLVAEDRAGSINQLEDVIKLFPTYLAYCLNESPNTLFFNHQPRVSYPHSFDFSKNAREITYTGGTVTFTCMQLAYYLGFKKIYLIGVDHNYQIPDTVQKENEYSVDILDMKEDDPNHFSPDYFGKGYRWHDPNVEKMEQSYCEAKKITEENGVQIINATKGGHLEVFERAEYDNLFASDGLVEKKEHSACVNFPVTTNDASREIGWRDVEPDKSKKILVISFTLMKMESATGALVRGLFEDWDKNSLAQIYTERSKPDETFCKNNYFLEETTFSKDCITKAILDFNPDLIYLRTSEQPPYLLDYASMLINKLKVPYVVHMMDDWPERERINNPQNYTILNSFLNQLIAKATLNLSICEKMSIAYQHRYSRQFYPVSNFVSREDWQSQSGSKKTDNVFTVRYLGSLAKDMQLQSVIDVASAVQSLSEEISIKLEVFVHRRFKKNTRYLSKFENVDIRPFVAPEEYQNALSGCDLLLIPSNFDEKSISYVRYSMANKLPECMASGVPILLYGSTSVATIDYALKSNATYHITERDIDALKSKLKYIALHQDESKELANSAKRFVFDNHEAEKTKYEFACMLTACIKKYAEK